MGDKIMNHHSEKSNALSSLRSTLRKFFPNNFWVLNYMYRAELFLLFDCIRSEILVILRITPTSKSRLILFKDEF